MNRSFTPSGPDLPGLKVTVKTLKTANNTGEELVAIHRYVKFYRESLARNDFVMAITTKRRLFDRFGIAVSATKDGKPISYNL